MNASSTSIRIYHAMTRRRYAWLATIPIAALLIAGATWGAREWAIDRENQLQFAQWAAAGIPFNNQTLEASYLRRTHPEGATDWIRVTRLMDWGAGTKTYTRIPYLGADGESPVELNPGGDCAAWPDQAFVANYLEEMEPIIDLIEQASQHPLPVRFPIKFQGYTTLLPHVQQARNILNLLALDCDYAYFKQDTDRALRDLRLMKSTAAAFDSPETLVTELVQIALQGKRSNTIRRTLTHCIWSDVELTKLRDSLSPQEGLGPRWEEVIYCERAFGLTTLNESPAGLSAALGRPILRTPVWPSDRKLMIDYYEEASQILFDIPSRWKQRADALHTHIQSKISQDSVVSMILPAFTQIMEAEIRNEDDRRWTLTAVALQQYKHQYGTWPQRLSDLETIGLSRDDYSTLSQELFGYEVDSTTVYLWTRKLNGPMATGHVSPTRPVPQDVEQRLENLLELKTSTPLPSSNKKPADGKQE